MSTPTNQALCIEQLLEAALQGQEAVWPPNWEGKEITAAVIERVSYHGIDGLLVEQSGRLVTWPGEILARLKHQAFARAMWEMRHHGVLANLLAALARHNIFTIVLKGTALAYDLYDKPATRSRGDTDILIARADINRARAILSEMEFQKDPFCPEILGELQLQEMWTFLHSDGTRHNIDLHWQTMDFPALEGILDFAECIENPLKLVRLCPTALGLSRVNMLLHACAHRGKHLTAPYYVDGITYYGGDRLIWAKDIDLLAGVLSEPEWVKFCDAAEALGLSAVCVSGLELAQCRLGTPIPAKFLERLRKAPSKTSASTYLLRSSKAARAWADVSAVQGVRRKLSYLLAHALPSREFMRSKYPQMQNKLLLLLYLRRFGELRRKPTGQNEH